MGVISTEHTGERNLANASKHDRSQNLNRPSRARSRAARSHTHKFSKLPAARERSECVAASARAFNPRTPQPHCLIGKKYAVVAPLKNDISIERDEAPSIRIPIYKSPGILSVTSRRFVRFIRSFNGSNTRSKKDSESGPTQETFL